MQVHTERGLINVEAEYQSEEKAKMDGYSYAFYSKELEKKVYSKCLDDRGLYHTFVLIVGCNQNNYFKGCDNMKANTYYLFDNGKKIAFSGSFERLLNKTTKTENAEIYYNNVLVWKQNPQEGVNNGKDFIIYKKIQW